MELTKVPSPQELPRDERFVSIMNKIAVVYNRAVTDQLLTVYDTILADVDIDLLAWGVYYMLRERDSSFFPVPAELRSWTETARLKLEERKRRNQPPLPAPKEDPAYDEYREANWEYVQSNLNLIKEGKTPEFTSEAQMNYILEVTGLTKEQILKFREE